MGRMPRSREWDRIYVSPKHPEHPDGNCSETSSQERVAKMARKINNLVDQSGLQPEFEEALAELRLLQARERQEKQQFRRHRGEQPEHLVAPSVAKLEIYGCWFMSDEVLEILLARVFCNVRELSE